VTRQWQRDCAEIGPIDEKLEASARKTLY